MPISNELREIRFRALCHSLLNDLSAKVRAESALALGRLRDERAIPNLCQALTDENEQVRINAVTALSILDESLTPSNIVTILILLLRVPSAMSETPKYDLRGANIGNFAETVQGDQISTQQNYAASQNLAEAAAEIQKLLEQLAQSNPAIGAEQDQTVALETLHQEIKRDPTLKSRLLNALKSGGTEALKLGLEAVFKNPLVAFQSKLSKAGSKRSKRSFSIDDPPPPLPVEYYQAKFYVFQNLYRWSSCARLVCIFIAILVLRELKSLIQVRSPPQHSHKKHP